MVHSRVEESHDLPCLHIDGGDIAPFQEIAEIARPGEIVLMCWPAMLLRDDMIRLVGEVHISLVDQAVLASAVGARLNETAEGCRHCAGSWPSCLTGLYARLDQTHKPLGLLELV